MDTGTTLIVEDDIVIGNLIREILRRDGQTRVIVTGSGVAASDLVQRNELTLLMLDLNLPDMDGRVLLRNLRTFSNIPVIVVTGTGSHEDATFCLDAGANAYIKKPFNPEELAGKVREIQIDSSFWKKQVHFSSLFSTSSGLSIDESRTQVLLGGKPVDLSLTEFRILRLLADHAGTFVPTQTIFEEIWGGSYLDVGIVRVNIARIRNKLGDDLQNPKYLMSERGKGYILAQSQ